MALPELVRRTAEKTLARYCSGQLPDCAREQGRLAFRIHDDHITLFAERAAAEGSGAPVAIPVARFRFSHELGQWSLHHPAGERYWRFYLNAGPSLDLGKLLRHLDADPLHFFWE
jgi:hypothetical protein